MYPGERLNAWSHFCGLILAVLAAVWMLNQAHPAGDPLRKAAAFVFAVSVIVLYAASTLFHSSRGVAKTAWERVDHCAIHLLIAGTTTPFAISGTTWLPLMFQPLPLIAVWILAGAGIWRVVSTRELNPPLWLYLSAGWIAVSVALPGAFELSPTAGALLIGGGALYSLGTVFHRNPWNYRHAHGIWHVFVLLGSAAHYVAIAVFAL